MKINWKNGRELRLAGEMKIKFSRKFVSLALSFYILISFPLSAVAVDVSGSQCKKAGEIKKIFGKDYRCEKKGKKRIWIKYSNSLAPNPSRNFFTIYNSGPGKSAEIELSKELQFEPQRIPEGENLRIWVFDPENPMRSLGSNGVFIKRGAEEWKWIAGRSDGTVSSQVATGEYLLDTVEPNNNSSKYQRKRYKFEVDSKGEISFYNLKSNSKGFFTLTIDLRNEILDNFIPKNDCQLRSQDGNKSLNIGFPRQNDRLKTSGEIRALILPLDFPDVVGMGDPIDDYYEMAKGTYEFFYRQSNGEVNIKFEIYPKFIRMPFISSKYQLGTWNAGDPGGYWQALISTADEFVDYSRFDVVYALSPKNIPWTSIAYGPANPWTIQTNDGPLKNGTHSGADAYQQFPGAGWKWMAHETGHLFGLHDLYTERSVKPTFGSWDLMSLNWSTSAIELSAWNRFILGWLRENQFKCETIETLGAGVQARTLIPLVEDKPGLRAQLIRLSPSTILVMEYRRTGGLDQIPVNQDGLLVYTVDTKIPTMKGGWKVQRRSGSTSLDLTDAALKIGDEITVQGITIKVLSMNSEIINFSISRI